MYEGDSFHTLSAIGQAGLLLLTTLLSAVAILIIWRIGRARPWPTRLAITLVAFWLFVWLSPQAYYAYYWFLFDGLPVQLVIKSPPSPLRVLRLAFFQEETTLSAHGKGVLFWLLVLASAFIKKAPSGETDN